MASLGCLWSTCSRPRGGVCRQGLSPSPAHPLVWGRTEPPEPQNRRFGRARRTVAKPSPIRIAPCELLSVRNQTPRNPLVTVRKVNSLKTLPSNKHERSLAHSHPYARDPTLTGSGERMKSEVG